MAMMYWVAYCGTGLLLGSAFRLWQSARAKEASPRISGSVLSLRDLAAALATWLTWALLWPLMAALWVMELRWQRADQLRKIERNALHDPVVVRPEHLVEHLEVATVEAREQVVDPLAAAPALPFGHLNPAWCKFAGHAAAGLELWSISGALCAPSGARRVFEGYAFVHERQPLHWFLTADFTLGASQ